ncbi:MAG: GntR family transcriptional regulator [Galactobacter sp.]
MPKDQPLQVPAAQRAYEHTKTLILDARVDAGQMLSEGEIASKLGISRTPVREAFTRLQSEGWLRLYPRRGALVVPPDPAQAKDLVDARIVLESSALQTSADRDRDRGEISLRQLSADLNLIREHQSQALDADDLSAFTAHDLAFHRAIIEASGNSVFLRFHDLVSTMEERMSMRSIWRSPQSAQRVLDQHQQLSSTVYSGDVERFRTTLRHHLLDIHSDLIT